MTSSRLKLFVLSTVAGLISSGALYAQSTVVTAVSPASGPVGLVLTVTGANFGASQGTGTITFGGIAGAPMSWTDTNIVVPVPFGASTGNVVVTAHGTASAPLVFT